MVNVSRDYSSKQYGLVMDKLAIWVASNITWKFVLLYGLVNLLICIAVLVSVLK